MGVPIRIGIIGAGGIVKRRHLPGFRDIEDCEVVAVMNRRRENAEAVAKEWNIPHVVDTHAEIYNRDDINVVLIGTTPWLHRDLTLASLEAGKHVFCQARMAANLAHARDMLEAAEKHKDLVTMVCSAPRADPVDKYVQKVLADGELGEIRLVRVQHTNDVFLDPELPLHWRLDAEQSGVQIHTMGQFVEIVHRWFEPAVSVSAWGKTFIHQRRDPVTGETKKVEIPETASATGQLKNGAQFIYTFSTLTPFGEGEKIEIYGSKGALIYTPANQTLMMGKVGEMEQPRKVEVPPAFQTPWTVEADFVAAIRENKPVYPDFRDGLAYMEFMEAVNRSIREEKMIHLPLKG